MPYKKYLTEATFQKFLDNDWKHLTREFWQLKGILLVLVPLVIAIFTKLLDWW